MVVMMLAPLVDLYEGDTLSLPYEVADMSPNAGITLAPLTPGTATATAALGQVSIAPDGMSGTITYTALKAGEDLVTVTVSNYFGTATGTTTLKIKPRPNYDLDIFVVSQDEDEAGGFFMALFNAQGSFANVPDHPIEGSGSSDFWFSLGVSSEVIGCLMTPPITGVSSFTISGQELPLVPLVPTPGFLPFFSLDLDFQPMPLNGTTISCKGLGDISMNFPWPGSTANPNDYPLQGLSFPGEGGSVQIKAAKTWGLATVTRNDQ